MIHRSSDVQCLLDLASGWRDVSRRSRYEGDHLLHDDDPGPHTTAIQLEWAAREIMELRDDLNRSRSYRESMEGLPEGTLRRV